MTSDMCSARAIRSTSSRIEHRWANESSHPVRVLWVNAPLPKGDADVSEPRPFELIENDALGNEPEH